MRTKLLAAVLASCTLALAGCGGGSAAQDDPNAAIKVGATAQPHGEILQFVKENLAAERDIEIEIETFSDYNRPNAATANGSLDANYYQHKPFLEEYKEERGGDLHWVAPVHLEPLGIYSKEIDSLDKVSDGASVMIPNDPSNRGRALKLLQSKGLIELKQGAAEETDVRDIVNNPKNLQIEELKAAQIPRSLQDVRFAVVNGNYALKANLDDPLALESTENNPYVNGVVTNSEMQGDPRIDKLVDMLRSQEVKDFINEQYGGKSVIPAS
ncbi:D-methionine transport system substrate-binding protein [Actinopolyspora lacussalsi subsp. righensis]|uniref:Lipoprotein n=1 Tax=Actinopolyspora righensis TaxID=995060 RepID=A0A1I7B5T2_9ACTN|nr:MetQ/NlpA family ABC transporter substrate-binding protein [Actinopolyspora righensis]SFT82487.1 D-methionine transport system substrate-binding protein [Actinopolyspora righensis]